MANTPAPAPSSLNRGPTVVRAPERARAGRPTAWNTENARPVEIVAPDPRSMALLLKEADSLFPAQLVATNPWWIVRLRPPAGGTWVLDLLALVERWLESSRLPYATVLYGGHSYLIRSSRERRQSGDDLLADVQAGVRP